MSWHNSEMGKTLMRKICIVSKLFWISILFLHEKMQLFLTQLFLNTLTKYTINSFVKKDPISDRNCSNITQRLRKRYSMWLQDDLIKLILILSQKKQSLPFCPFFTISGIFGDFLLFSWFFDCFWHLFASFENLPIVTRRGSS